MQTDSQFPSSNDKDIAMMCSNEILELHVLPTEKCNFRCSYCYEDFSVGRMTPEIIRGVKQLLSRRARDLRVLHLAWFGGEPLTALDIVEEISTHSRDLSALHGFSFRSSMTTNGWGLTLPTLARLAEIGVRDYQITLDGPQAVHDSVRRRADGTGTFDRIWKNLQAAKRSDLAFNIMIRLHIRPDTLAEVSDWVHELRDELICDPRFRVLVKTVEHLGGKNDATIRIYRNDEARHAASKSLYDRLPGGSAFRDDIFGRACYAGRPNAWVIRASGDLARCTVALADSANRIGRLTEEGEMIIDQEKLRPWFHGLLSMDSDVLSCPAKTLPRNL
jgi:uncharacterized protein